MINSRDLQISTKMKFMVKALIRKVKMLIY
jgi:hypothetical protein